MYFSAPIVNYAWPESMMNRSGNSGTSRTVGLRIYLVSCDSELNVQHIVIADVAIRAYSCMYMELLSVRRVDWKRFHAFNPEPGSPASGVGIGAVR